MLDVQVGTNTHKNCDFVLNLNKEAFFYNSLTHVCKELRSRSSYARCMGSCYVMKMMEERGAVVEDAMDRAR